MTTEGAQFLSEGSLESLTLDDIQTLDEAAAPAAPYTLNLLENALDSLNEGLTQFRAFEAGRVRASKFAVLHFSHYLELLLKHCVATFDEEEIWIRPGFSKEAIACIETLVDKFGVKIRASFKTDLQWFKKLRNNVEHYEFALDVEEVRGAIARLLYDATIVVEACHVEVDFVGGIDIENVDLFATLSQEYAARLKVAQDKVAEAERRTDWRSGQVFEAFECVSCLNDTLISDSSSSTGYRCQFCGGTAGEDMEVHCSLCGVLSPRWNLREFEDWDGHGSHVLACPRCRGDYLRDD